MTKAEGGARITEAIREANDEGRAAFIPFATAGYPDAETSLGVAVALIDAGADVLEIGLPYSDPLADGATIQHASAVALANGATLDDSIALIGRIHEARPRTPLVTMGYCNQVLGGADGATVLQAPWRGRRVRLHPRRHHARRERGAGGGSGRLRDRPHLPRGPDHARRPAAVRGRPLAGLPLRGLARGRHRGAHFACRRA